MREYEIVDTNADNIGACNLCGNKAGKNEGHRRKSDWLKKRYAEGLRYKVLRSREFGDIGMIEYTLGRHAWRPVEAEGYLVIHCLTVNGKHKGKGLGAVLLGDCLRDARKSKCRGVAVVTSSDSFMAGSGLFIKAGFVSVESNPPYELLVKKFKATAPDPRFIVDRERVLKRHTKGLTILAADQCTYVAKSVESGEDFAGGPRPGPEAESGSNQERQGIKGASDALWRVQHYLRWKADCGASGQRNEIHEHHE
jgi:N-acetylglutamate synthase-like GNAT family acetyltransferase